MGTGRGQGSDQRALSEEAEHGSRWGAAAAGRRGDWGEGGGQNGPGAGRGGARERSPGRSRGRVPGTRPCATQVPLAAGSVPSRAVCPRPGSCECAASTAGTWRGRPELPSRPRGFGPDASFPGRPLGRVSASSCHGLGAWPVQLPQLSARSWRGLQAGEVSADFHVPARVDSLVPTLPPTVAH